MGDTPLKPDLNTQPEFPWEDLLLQIEDQRVIPVIGPDLLVVNLDGRDVPLHAHLAATLASELEIAQQGLVDHSDLQQLASYYTARSDRPQRLYSRLKVAMQKLAPTPSRPLQKLAEIRNFNLYVSTTFDGLLADAIDEVRFAGDQKTRRLAHSPHLRVQDLPSGKEDLSTPVVYQIFGPLTSSTDYAVTDEDMLEFINALQSPERRPRLLFDELRNNHLLFIGCSYSDWLSRFFLRTVRNERLSLRHMSEMIADDRTLDDPGLVRFLHYLAVDVYTEGGACTFVDELHRRWMERNPKPTSPSLTRQHNSGAPHMEPDAIFLSYAREDRDAVRKTFQGLESIGLDAWFDESAIEPGDDWDRNIRRNIKNCSLFMPVISRNSAERPEGYFRKEWRWAIDRAQGMDDRFAFIIPIAIDDTGPEAGGIPDFFQTKHWHNLPQGLPDRTFLENTRTLVRGLRMRKAGLR